jgi:hypothetical protein
MLASFSLCRSQTFPFALQIARAYTHRTWCDGSVRRGRIIDPDGVDSEQLGTIHQLSDKRFDLSDPSDTGGDALAIPQEWISENMPERVRLFCFQISAPFVRPALTVQLGRCAALYLKDICLRAGVACARQ